MTRILILTPNPHEAARLKQDLSVLNAEIHVAKNGGEATNVLGRTQMDVAIFDASVVETEGLERLLRLRELSPDLQAIALVPERAYATLLSDIQTARFDYLRKPVHPADLVHKVKQALDRLWLEGHSRQLAALLDRRVQDLKSLYEMAQKISSSLDYDRVAVAMTATIQEILHAEGASPMLWDAERGKIRIDAATGSGGAVVKGMTLGRGEGIVGWAIEHDEPVLVKDVSQDSRFSSRIDRATGLITRSVACAPLRSKGKVIGAVEAVNRLGGLPFGESDLGLLVAVASHAALALDNAQLCKSLTEEREKLEQHNRDIRNLCALNRRLNALVNYDELVEYLVTEGAHVVGECKLAALLVQEESGFFLYLPPSGQLSERSQRELIEQAISHWNRLSPLILSEDKITTRHLGAADQSPPAAQTLPLVAAIPLVAKKKMMGLLMLADTQEKELNVATMKILAMAGNHAAVSIENALLYEQTERLSKMDGLTGVYNRRSFEEQLTLYYERARRFKERLSLILVDADYFKMVNDTYGHQVGDRVLKQLALIIVGEVRAIDPVFRYGGEEFSVLLPEAHKDGALIVAERVRQKVGAVDFGGETPLSMTVSIGVSAFPDPRVTEPASLISLADKALYEAKAAGRNQVRSI